MKTLAALLLAFHVIVSAARAATGFETNSLLLYQTDEVLRTRLPNVGSLADYVQQLQKVCADFFATTTEPETLQIVVAVKPGKLARVWFVSSTRADNQALEPLRKKLEAVPAMEVFSGPVAFAISARIAGGDGQSKSPEKNAGFPIPKEWKDVIKDAKSPIPVPDSFLALVWPDPPGADAPVSAPAGFINQVLEPTGGRIFRPKDWFYAEDHHGPVYVWTLSREDTSGHRPYTTGVRVQLFSGVKQGTGKTPKEFILDFVANKKKEAAKVLKSCEPRDQGLFTRMCLETEEGPYHILYSLYWSADQTDLAVVTISGTTKELWETFSPTFDRMTEFEIIDMKRFDTHTDSKPPMTRIESRFSSPQTAPDAFAAKPKVVYFAGTAYLRSEEQADPTQGVHQLIVVHEPDIWLCDRLKLAARHIVDPGPSIVVHARILQDAPPVFSDLEFAKEVRFFHDHHATSLPAETLEGQPCEVSEFKETPFRVVLFQRADTHQPFRLDVFKDDKADFSIHYLSYQTDLPFDPALFTPPDGFTVTENAPKGGK